MRYPHVAKAIIIHIKDIIILVKVIIITVKVIIIYGKDIIMLVADYRHVCQVVSECM